MEITPGRAPYTEDEVYIPMRQPKSAANTPTHSNSSFNSQASSTSTAYQRPVSPMKLSPYATEFTPSSIQDRLQHQQRFQQQHNQQNYNHYQQKQYNNYSRHNTPHHHHHQQHQQQQHQHHRYANGFQQMPQHHNPHHQQQYVPQMAPLTSAVQERLNLGSSSKNYSSPSSSKNASSNNYNSYNNRQRHHQPYQSSGSQAAANHQTPAVEVETIALEYLQTVIQCLNQNPGQFDTIATRFITIFDGMESNEYVLSIAMEDIFQESIQNPNFRYMGAKLYNLLHMLNLKKDSLFHTLLKCKMDYHQTELLQYMQHANQHQMVRETALFLAELYMQLRGDDSRIHLIAENIVFSLKQLLSKENADNVRCICLTLKLAGYDLTSDCPTDMQQIIEQLDAINCKTPGKYPLAANVISLQKNNWGRKLSSSNSMCEDEEKLKRSEPLRISDDPIFYGPDGREITEEESDFLTGQAGFRLKSTVSTDEEDMPDLDVDLDPEMDEEAEQAYLKFCKLNETKNT